MRLMKYLCHDGAFQSTPPARGATQSGPSHRRDPQISIHAPREGGDCAHELRRWFDGEFQSTPPARGATLYLHLIVEPVAISIHAPREGGDVRPPPAAPHRRSISIHAPREGGDGIEHLGKSQHHHFNPRPPRGGRLVVLGVPVFHGGISIHAPREGGDDSACRGGRCDPAGISIHAPREGGDSRSSAKCSPPLYFNPRPPRGGRRGAACDAVAPSPISIHAPREGGDPPHRRGRRTPAMNFNPRPPRGGRLCTFFPHHVLFSAFQSTPPARGATSLALTAPIKVLVFQSTPPARGATAKMHSFTCGSLTNK